MSDSWENALTDVQKVLGPSAKIPDKARAKVLGLIKSLRDQESRWAEFDRLKEPLNKKVDDIKKAYAGIQADVRLADQEISHSNFGLNPKTDKTKIDQAHVIFQKFFRESFKTVCGTEDMDFVKSALAKLGKPK
jgi:hypothetical protein